MATLSAVANIPALGLLSEEGELEHTTEPFRRWYADKEDLCRSSPELQRVLSGQANAAVLKLEHISIDIAAMVDTRGERHVLLTVPTEELPSLGDAGSALLDGALDESPALAWLKDMDGRYVRANPRFTGYLGTSEDRLLGRTEAELDPAETVDGPRMQDRAEDVEEPLQLEYFVGAYQGREALVALRFPVADAKGVPTLVCGVAAPSGDADLARSEAARLLRIERWSRLDAESVRAELLADWGVLPDPRGRSATAAPPADHVTVDREHQAAVAEARAERATAVAERDAALSANEKLALELEVTRSRLTELERTGHSEGFDEARAEAEAALTARAEELERILGGERKRSEELEQALAQVRDRLSADADAARLEVERARADVEAARNQVEQARADADAARSELDKARTAADKAVAAAAAERDSASSARAALEREVQEARQHLAQLERAQGTDDAQAEVLRAEKARAAAETALADAMAERDATLKAKAIAEGELEQERVQVAALRKSTEASDERIRELGGELERERVRRTELEGSAARIKQQLEADAETARTQAAEFKEAADKVRSELEQARGKTSELEAAAGKARIELAQVRAEAEGARAEAERVGLRAGELEERLEQVRGRAAELEAAGGDARTEAVELKAQAREARADAERARAEAVEARALVERARTEAEQAQALVERARTEAGQDQLRAGKLEAELDVARSEVERHAGRASELEGALLAARGEMDAARGELEAARGELEAARGEIDRETARAGELVAELEQARARAEEAEASIAELQEQLEQATSGVAEPGGDDELYATERSSDEVPADPMPADAMAAEDIAEQPADIGPLTVPGADLATREAAPEAADATGRLAVSWQPTAKRALSASLARETVWRGVLKETVEVLGSEGGWDTVTAWLPDPSDRLECAAMWTAHAGLGQFQNLTSGAPLERDGSLLAQAMQAPHLTWLTDIDVVDDERLQSAAAHGMSSALLLPVRDGGATIGLLELLTHASIEPDAQIALSLEASALQLGRFAHQLSLGARPLNAGPRGD
jgi:PAS domain-containing protein